MIFGERFDKHSVVPWLLLPLIAAVLAQLKKIKCQVLQLVASFCKIYQWTSHVSFSYNLGGYQTFSPWRIRRLVIKCLQLMDLESEAFRMTGIRDRSIDSLVQGLKSQFPLKLFFKSLVVFTQISSKIHVYFHCFKTCY